MNTTMKIAEDVEGIEPFLFQISELASIVVSFCDITTSKHLTSVNRSLYKLRNDELLWRNKVQKEFGVVKFKPVEFTFLQQYLTLNNNASAKVVRFTDFFESQGLNRNVIGGRAGALGRCDQLRIIRRTSYISHHDLAIIAIEHDQVFVIEYLENFEKYLLPHQHWKNEVGHNIALYLVNKVFADRNNVCGFYKDRPEHYFILRNLLFPYRLPINLVDLLIEQSNKDIVSWYITFTTDNMVTKQRVIYNDHTNAL